MVYDKEKRRIKYLANKDACIAYVRLWRKRNKEKFKKQLDLYRQRHPEKIKEIQRRYASNNIQKCRDARKKWEIKNPDKRKIITRRHDKTPRRMAHRYVSCSLKLRNKDGERYYKAKKFYEQYYKNMEVLNAIRTK